MNLAFIKICLPGNRHAFGDVARLYRCRVEAERLAVKLLVPGDIGDLDAWEKGWTCLFGALESLKPEDLSRLIFIRNEGQTVLEAIQRQLAHYPHHVGQILYQAKAIKGNEFKSLSIPKGKSESFNKEKFDKEKTRKHFTDNDGR